MIAFSSILEGALCVLREPDPFAKAAIAEALALRCADLPLRPPPTPSVGGDGAGADADANANAAANAAAESLAPPAKPARPSHLETVEASKAPKRGRGGTLASRVAILHALVHIESWAVDLAADCVARFAAAAGGGASAEDGGYPRSLATDFVAVLADEARHFLLLDARLRQVHPEGKGYGCLPVHEGLWESAGRTARSLPARLAVESCLHEARGLDVLPTTASRLRAAGDAATADLLERVVYGEEIAHCAAGVRWLTFLHARARGEGEKGALRRASAAAGPPVAFPLARAGGGKEEDYEEEEEAVSGDDGEKQDEGGDDDNAFPSPAGHGEEDWREDARRHATPPLWFRSLVSRNFHGRLMPPFNEEARARAGFTPEWYAEENNGGALGAEGDGRREAGEGRREEEEQEEEEAKERASASAAAEETDEGGGARDARPRDQREAIDL